MFVAWPVNRQRLLWCALLLAALGLMMTHATAASIPVSVTMSEPVTVSVAGGTPQIAIDVGGVQRFAAYQSGSGTQILTFAYQVQPGDFDANGITIPAPQIQPNGGTIRDAAGNNAVLSFSAPDTSNIKVQTYQPSIPGGISPANANAVGFTITKAPSGTGYSYSYTISGANGGSLSAGPISYNGSVSVTGLNLSAWPAGDVTLTVRIDGPSGQGKPVSITVSPSGRPLDGFPAMASAYSVRQLRSAYTGPLMMVRSAAGGSLAIGATQAGTLDTAALTGFCGLSTCFVSTWYDQSGNGNDAVQATDANQPQIASGGAVEVNGAGRPALRTLSIYTALNAGPPMATSAEFTIVMALQTASIASQWAWGMTRWPGQVSSNCPWSDGNCYFDVGGISGPVRIVAYSNISPGVPYVATFANSVSASTQFTRINGTQIASDATGHSVALEALSIMNNYEFSGGRNNRGQIGTVSEFVIFPSLLSLSDRQAVEQSMKTAFGP